MREHLSKLIGHRLMSKLNEIPLLEEGGFVGVGYLRADALMYIAQLSDRRLGVSGIGVWKIDGDQAEFAYVFKSWPRFPGEGSAFWRKRSRSMAMRFVRRMRWIEEGEPVFEIAPA